MLYEQAVHPTNHPTNEGSGVQATGLGKRFGDLWALRGLDLDVPKGTVLGLLGHNGAGKTTALRMLTTISTPTEGRASVAGFDVVTHPLEVRRRIGVAAQEATVDGLMSARLNLELLGRLHHRSKADARRRADDLLEQLGLAAEAANLVKTFSGGMRRRLDLAASLVGHPEVLFLDEPTTGLDPRSRRTMWQIIRDLVADGVTILLTTQYLEEADQLADRIAVIDHGSLIASGTADELKDRLGSDVLDVQVSDAAFVERAAELVAPLGNERPQADKEARRITMGVSGGPGSLVQVVRLFDEAGIAISDLAVRRPSLDDVFLTLTGHAATDETVSTNGNGKRGRAAGRKS
jgi:ABC-2 type transport system ATP-binding protein